VAGVNQDVITVNQDVITARVAATDVKLYRNQ
jgi:hypothetical protein